jgi:hypothetical protein
MTPKRRFIFLGDSVLLGDAVFLGDSVQSRPPVLCCDGLPITPGTTLELERRRSPWPDSRDIERIIVGSHPTRADLRIEGPGIVGEHARLYLSRNGATVNDFRAVIEDTVRVNGQSAGHEWRALNSGDEIELGRWRFRFEIVSSPQAESRSAT